MAQTSINGLANRLSTNMRYQAGMQNASFQYSQNQQQINNNLISGLFGAASMGVSNYFMTKPLKTPQTGLWNNVNRPGGGFTSEGLSYVRGPTLTDPGGSLLGASSR